MKYFLLIAILLTGCASEETKKYESERGKLRHELFVECMELAAKMPRQADDDVSDIIQECSNQTYYISNGMKP